jgi:CRP/FNR family transcriptional regulator, dissimilatory nitrate respiration regulator
MKMNTQQFDMQNYLSALPMFGNFSKPERENVVRDCQLRRLARGDMVFRAGEECEAFHFIISGQVKLYFASSSGQEKVIEIVGPGQSFAEAMMFLQKPHLYNAQTLADTLMMSIGKRAVLGEIKRDHRFSMHMLTGISHCMHRLLQDVEGYALHSGMQRLIGYLLRNVPEGNTVNKSIFTVSLPVSKATIASRLSLTPEYFSRVLHELETERLIEIDKREIRILDARRLANYCVT